MMADHMHEHVVAAGPPDLSDLLFGGRSFANDPGRSMPHLARFRSDTGDSFILELSGGGAAFLKYDDSGEVWALTPTPGARGDVIYKNDVGEAMLRTTRMGGLTVFTNDRPAGIAAAFESTAPDLHKMLFSGPIAMLQVMIQASARVSRLAGRKVEFDVPDSGPSTEAIFADAANLTVQAFARVDHKGKIGHDAIGRYDRVNFINGRPPGVKVVGEEVVITVTPDLGFAGRPSSQRISQVLFRR